MKIAVGLSGGVDSAVAAWLLKDAGHDVFGVSMTLWDRTCAPHDTPRKHACYGPDEAQELDVARQVCATLGIPFYTFNCARPYREIVLAYFQEEYQAGRTPNPCVRCNQLVKFDLLPLMIQQAHLPFDAFATGHYAQVDFARSTGRYVLRKAKDAKKDQSYFLYRLSQPQLAQVRFPLAPYTKTQVREMARRAGLNMVADLAESQDFYSGDYHDLLHLPDQPGQIVDVSGNVLGTHRGIWQYTIGQRKGLGIAAAEPLYVIRLDQAANTVIVGPRSAVYRTTCQVENLNWIALETLTSPLAVKVKLRSAHKAADAHIEPLPAASVKVTFVTPQEAITPGQSAVFYDGDVVLGGGMIQMTM